VGPDLWLEGPPWTPPPLPLRIAPAPVPSSFVSAMWLTAHTETSYSAIELLHWAVAGFVASGDLVDAVEQVAWEGRQSAAVWLAVVEECTAAHAVRLRAQTATHAPCRVADDHVLLVVLVRNEAHVGVENILLVDAWQNKTYLLFCWSWRLEHSAVISLDCVPDTADFKNTKLNFSDERLTSDY